MLKHAHTKINAAHSQEVSREGVCQKGLTLSTADIAPRDRRDWLEGMICQEYTRVDVKLPSDGHLYNETTLYPWEKLRLSVIHSRGLTIDKRASEPYAQHHDNYLAVILLSGRYALTQYGREVFLKPGDMTIYDATQPHRIYSPSGFSKLLVSIPRALMRDSVAGIEHCTSLRVAGDSGIGAVTSGFIQSAAKQAAQLDTQEFSALSEQSLDLMALAFRSVRPQHIELSRTRSLSLRIIKDFVKQHLSNPALDTNFIAAGTRFSPRYMNALFQDEGTSLMRYVWASRLAQCHQEILNFTPFSISCTAYKWGFNDMSHFSRAFKKQFGVSPSALKHRSS